MFQFLKKHHSQKNPYSQGLTTKYFHFKIWHNFIEPLIHLSNLFTPMEKAMPPIMIPFLWVFLLCNMAVATPPLKSALNTIQPTTGKPKLALNSIQPAMDSNPLQQVPQRLQSSAQQLIPAGHQTLFGPRADVKNWISQMGQQLQQGGRTQTSAGGGIQHTLQSPVDPGTHLSLSRATPYGGELSKVSGSPLAPEGLRSQKMSVTQAGHPGEALTLSKHQQKGLRPTDFSTAQAPFFEQHQSQTFQRNGHSSSKQHQQFNITPNGGRHYSSSSSYSSVRTY